MIQLSNVDFRFDNNIVLQHVNLNVNKGDFIAITGPNGGGKTTLIRLVLGLLHPSAGVIRYPEPHPTIGYLPQKSTIDTRFPINVEQVVASGLINRPIGDTDRKQAIEQTLSDIDLESKRGNAISDLSGGQLQRALLGRAIIARPQLLVLDEPLSYLDQTFSGRFYEILNRLAPTTTILLVSHELDTIARIATRHLIVHRTVQECDAAHHFSHTRCD